MASETNAPVLSAAIDRSAIRHALPLRRRRRLRHPIAPLLSVVIVNFRQWDNTVALTHQLDSSDCMRSGQAEVLLVDNDPNPHPLRRCVRGWPSVSLRCFNHNRGFARAVNEGCRRARGRWILLLNPDIEIPDEFLDHVLQAAEKLNATHPRVGLVGFQLRHADGTRQGSTGPFPTFWNVLSGLLRPRARRRCQPMAVSGPRWVPWVTGCCMLVRRDCWRELQGFDEDFFLYYEDVDLCKRARERGWDICYDPTIRVVHFRPLHTRKVPAALRLMTRHALLTYASKHWARGSFRLLGGLIWAEALARGAIAWLRRQEEAVGHFRRMRRMTLDLLRGRVLRARHGLLRSARIFTAGPRASTRP